jgi:heterotetrameric sarcosine oxidase gamma subunit
MRAVLGDIASCTDQSSGIVIFQLAGRATLAAIAQLVPVDVHPRAFEHGMAATTSTNHIGISLWRLRDSDAGHAVFNFAVYRSYARSLLKIIDECATAWSL